MEWAFEAYRISIRMNWGFPTQNQRNSKLILNELNKATLTALEDIVRHLFFHTPVFKSNHKKSPEIRSFHLQFQVDLLNLVFH